MFEKNAVGVNILTKYVLVKMILPQQSKKYMTSAVTDYDNAGELPDNTDALLDTIERLPASELKYISKK